MTDLSIPSPAEVCRRPHPHLRHPARSRLRHLGRRHGCWATASRRWCSPSMPRTRPGRSAGAGSRSCGCSVAGDRFTVFNWDRGEDLEPLNPTARAIVDYLVSTLAERVYG